MARDDTQFRLRLPEKLREEIIQQAEKNGRSINAEIVARLENSLGWDKFDPEDMSMEIEVLRTGQVEISENIRDLWRAINSLRSGVK